jgi:hypothetical protein
LYTFLGRLDATKLVEAPIHGAYETQDQAKSAFASVNGEIYECRTAYQHEASIRLGRCSIIFHHCVPNTVAITRIAVQLTESLLNCRLETMLIFQDFEGIP